MFTKKSISNKIILYQCPEISLFKGFELLKEKNKFKDYFINILRTFKKFKFYFIEFPPCSFKSPTVQFQFVLINAEHTELKEHIADFSDFQEYHTKKNKIVLQFPSLSKDSLLSVPVPLPKTKEEIYTSIAPFMRLGNVEQIHEIWTKVSEKLIDSIKADKKKQFWVSTSGLAVPWLHVRIDLKPKYYNYEPFKRS